MSAGDFDVLNGSRTEAVRGLRGGLAHHLGIERVQVEIGETSPDILTGLGESGSGANASLLEGADVPAPRELANDGIADDYAERHRRQDALRGRSLSQGPLIVDYELSAFPQSIPALLEKLENSRADAIQTAALAAAIVAALGLEGLSVSVFVVIKDVVVTATTAAPPATTTTTTTVDFLEFVENSARAHAREQLEAVAGAARVFFAGLGGFSVLAMAFFIGLRWRSIWKSAPIVPNERESTAWVDDSQEKADALQKEQEENVLMTANQRLQSQIERMDIWRTEADERQRRSEVAAKARCDALLEENRALSDEVRSLRESTTGSPDMETPEPPVDLPSISVEELSRNFLAARSKQALVKSPAFKKQLTKAFGKEKAAMIRARSEAVAEIYFSDV
jgi:hypothetical protein